MVAAKLGAEPGNHAAYDYCDPPAMQLESKNKAVSHANYHIHEVGKAFDTMQVTAQ